MAKKTVRKPTPTTRVSGRTAAPRRARPDAAKARKPASRRGARAAEAKVTARRSNAGTTAARAATARAGERLGKYVYCIIRSRKPLALGPIEVDVSCHKPLTIAEAGNRKLLAKQAEDMVRKGLIESLSGVRA